MAIIAVGTPTADNSIDLRNVRKVARTSGLISATQVVFFLSW